MSAATEHYVTLFDSGFLAHALALHASLLLHGGDFHLWAVCLDDRAAEAIARLALPRMTAIPLHEVEGVDARLPATRPTRSRAEYCWTLTPFVFDAAFNRSADATRMTYVDVDVAFFGDPSGLFDELVAAGKQVLITEHAFAQRYAHLIRRSGRFCVQFLTMTRTAEAARVRRWWQERCLEWCFDRYEPGRFGDQMYLDQWPDLFPHAVHILVRTDATQAPWNRERFGHADPVIFHFQGFRRIADDHLLLFYGFSVPPGLRTPYAAYMRMHAQALATLRQAGCDPPTTRYHWAKLLKARWLLAPLGLAAFARLPPVPRCAAS